MALNRLGLGFIFSARDLASRKIDRLNRNFNKLDRDTAIGVKRIKTGTKQAIGGLALFAAGVIPLIAAIGVADVAGKFQQGLAAVGKISGATGKELDKLRNSAIQAGIATQFSPKEAVDGLTSLAAAGQNVRKSTETLIPVLDLAAGSIGQLGVAEAAQVTVGVLNAFGFAAEEAGGRVDQLLRITQLTNFQARDFSIALSQAAAQANLADQSFEETIATLGVLRNTSLDASSSATSFREAVRKLTSDSGALKKVQELGINPVDQQTKKFKALSTIVEELEPKLSKLGRIQRAQTLQTLFGVRGVKAFNAISKATFETIRNGRTVTLRGVEAFRAIRSELGRSTGTAKSFREALLDTFEGQKTLLKGTLETFAIVLGEPFAKVFKPIVKAVTDGINLLIQAFNALPAGVKTGIALFITIGSALVAAAGAALALKGVFLILSGVFTLFVAPALITIKALALPIIAAVVGIGIAVAALALIFKRDLGGISTFFVRSFGRVKLLFKGLVQLFEQGGFSGAVRKELNLAENTGLKRFAVNVFRIGFRIKQFFVGIAEGFGFALELTRPLFEALVLAFDDLVVGIGQIFGLSLEAGAILPSATFKGFGRIIGFIAAQIIPQMVTALTVMVTVINATVIKPIQLLISLFRELKKVGGSVIGFIAQGNREIFSVTRSIGGALGIGGAEAPTGAQPAVAAATTIAARPAVAAATAQREGARADIQAAAQAGSTAAGRPVQVTSVIELDGVKVGEMLAEVQAGEANLAFEAP